MKLIIQEANKPNKNNRIYSSELLQREVNKWTTKFVNENKAFICKNPPENGTINLLDIIGKVNYIGVEEDKLVVEADMLHIPGAEIIWSLLEEGKLFVRMAGMGTETKQEDGTLKVNNDYELISLFVTEIPA